MAHVIRRVSETHDTDAQEFLAAFFTSGARRTELAAGLSGQPWDQVFVFLTNSNDVPDDVRPALVSSALAAADPRHPYNLDDKVRGYIERHYLTMPVFLEEQSPEVAEGVAHLVSRSGAVIPVLDAVRGLRLRRIFIADSRYKFTAANLRAALNEPDEEPIDLDHLSLDADVLENCLNQPDAYLKVAEETTRPTGRSGRRRS